MVMRLAAGLLGTWLPAFGVLPAAAQSDDPGADNFVPAIEVEVEGEDEPDAGLDEFPSRPDLVLIDGGLGQLGVAREVLAELGIDDAILWRSR